MKSANNMQELTQMILKEMDLCMQEASQEAKTAMDSEMDNFYTSKKPKVYKRTGEMKKTPKVTPIATQTTSPVSGSVSFEAYLETSHRYTSGKNPTMKQVLEVAENHNQASYYKLRPPVGRQGFWKRSEEEIGKGLNRALRKRFKLKYNKK